MRTAIFKGLFAAAAVGFICGCASLNTLKTPDFYPNEKYLNSTIQEVRQAEDQCIALANGYVKQPDKYRELAKDTLIDGAVGAGVGAVSGAIMGNAGRATGAGAAVGAILGILKGLRDMNEPSPSYQRFVEHCLHKKGYEIIGWSSK